MERRHFLKLAFGFAAGAAALAAGVAEAAPLAPQPLSKDLPPANNDAQPAVTTGDEVDRLSPDEVRWGRRGWGRRGWGWRRRGWRRRRYWGFRRRYWRRRRRFWRRRYW
jgi:hypothetical protein